MHYLIDLDNTLLDTFHIDETGKTHFYWSKNFKTDFGVSPTILNDLFKGEFLLAMQQTRELTSFIDNWIKKHQLKTTPADFLEYWLSRDANINTSVWDWIKAKKTMGHHIHIASNQPHVRMDYLWGHLPEWHTVFEKIFTSARLNASKPDKRFFQQVRETLNVPFSDICLIDDSPENIVTAKKLGMKAVLFHSVQDLSNE